MPREAYQTCPKARETLSRVFELLREGGFLEVKNGKETHRWVGPGGRIYFLDLSAESPGKGISGSVQVVVSDASGITRHAGRFVVSATGRILRFPKLPPKVRTRLKKEGLVR